MDLKVLRFVVKDLCSDYGGYNNRHFGMPGMAYI